MDDFRNYMKRRVWDNANIIESYPGVCTPLTFSFARASYRDVYAQLMDAFHVSRKLRPGLRRRYDAFLGYLGGRFYYNLETWCMLVSYLPGSGKNPEALQEMMGVRSTDRLAIRVPRQSLWHRAKGAAMALWYHVRLPSMSQRWLSDFDKDLPAHVTRVSTASSPDALMEAYFLIENRFLFQWTVPILNDIAVMSYTGMLRRAFQRDGIKELDPSWLMDIGSGGNVRMITLLRALAEVINQESELAPIVLSGEHDRAWQALVGHSHTSTLCAQLIADFGMRNGNDLKLETPNFSEQPGDFIPVLIQYCKGTTPSSKASQSTMPTRHQWLVRKSRQSMNQREEMRLKRSKIFGLVRQLFIRLGDELVKARLLETRDDIFFLEVEECWQLVRGTSTLSDVRGLVSLRRKEYNNYLSEHVQPHLVTDGVPHLEINNQQVADATGTELAGRSNYPVSMTGIVVVMMEPDYSVDVRGKILVCPQTDPGWVPILGLVGGLIVERGGILSHAAIFSRELHIPSIVGVEGACARLKTGQQVRLDGSTGKVYIV